MQKHSRQDDGNEVDHEMADHVRDQVASPEIDEHQDCAESEGKDDVNEPIGSMPEAEDQQRDDSGPVAVQSKQLKPLLVAWCLDAEKKKIDIAALQRAYDGK